MNTLDLIVLVRRVIPLLVILGLWAIFHFKLRPDSFRYGSRQGKFALLATLVGTLAWYYYAEPYLYHLLLYKGLKLHSFHILAVLTIYPIGRLIWKRVYVPFLDRNDRVNWRDGPGGRLAKAHRMTKTWYKPFLVGVLCLMVTIIIPTGLLFFIIHGQEYAIAKRYKFDASNHLERSMITDKKRNRYMPLAGWAGAIWSTSSASPSTQSSITMYVPSTPTVASATSHHSRRRAGTPSSSTTPIASSSNNDNAMLPKGIEKRVRPVMVDLKIGQGMEWIWWPGRSLKRALYLKDFTAEYHDVYYIQGANDPSVIWTIVPKIEYEYEFPCFWVPVQTGVLVNKAGTDVIEGLTMAEAVKDPRFKKKHLYSEWLVLKGTQAQRSDQGYISGFIPRDNKIQIPILPGKNQMPYYWDGMLPGSDESEHWYLVLTEPDGKDTKGLFRAYWWNATDGRFFWHEWPEGTLLSGPNRSRNAVYNKKTDIVYTTEAYEEGDTGETDIDDRTLRYRVIESRYISNEDSSIWFAYTCTTEAYYGVTFTAVVDARDFDGENLAESVIIFFNREDFEDWLNNSGADWIPKRKRLLMEQRVLLEQYPLTRESKRLQRALDIVKELLNQK